MRLVYGGFCVQSFGCIVTFPEVQGGVHGAVRSPAESPALSKASGRNQGPGEAENPPETVGGRRGERHKAIARAGIALIGPIGRGTNASHCGLKLFRPPNSN